MRVLHLHSGNLYGGVESCLPPSSARRGSRRVCDTSFAVCFEGRFSAELAALGRTPRPARRGAPQPPAQVRRARAALRDLLRRRPADAVVCQQPWSLVVFGPGGTRLRVPRNRCGSTWPATGGTGWSAPRASPRPTWSSATAASARGRSAGGCRARPAQVAYCPVSAPAPAAPGARRALRRALGDDDGTGDCHGRPRRGVEGPPRADRRVRTPERPGRLELLAGGRRAARRRDRVSRGTAPADRERGSVRAGPAAGRPRRRARRDRGRRHLLPAEPRTRALRPVLGRGHVCRPAGRHHRGRRGPRDRGRDVRGPDGARRCRRSSAGAWNS